MASVTIVATLILGWSMQVRADLAVPVVFSFFVGAGTSFLATSTSLTVELWQSDNFSFHLWYRYIPRSGWSSDCIGTCCSSQPKLARFHS
jgi:hypothetical protein